MSCNRCRQSSCCCGTPTTYLNADVCKEDHAEKIYINQFSFSVCANSAWNVPLCGGTAVLEVPGLVGATVGANIWHPDYGYFEINSVNAVNGTIGITNNCVSGNASPGTEIPACTCFVVTPPPIGLSPDSSVCLAVSFTAPAVDVETDITLTSTTGLAVGDTVSIGSGFYFVLEIKPGNVITIVNQGEGIVPGTPVIAQDANGNYLNCLSVIRSSPCSLPEVDEGFIQACNDDGVTGPLNPDTFDGLNSDAVSNTLTFVDPTSTGTTTPVTLSFTNSSPSRPMTIMVSWIANYTFTVNGAKLNAYDIQASVNAAAYATILTLPLTDELVNSGGEDLYYRQVCKTTTHTVAAGATLSLAGRAYILLFGAGTITTCSLNLEMKSIAITI